MLKYPDIIITGLLLFLIGMADSAFSQKDVSFQYLDSLTYSQYLNKQWKPLIKTSKIAYKNDIDYYYMRMRTGIALYERKNYLRAIKHFRKAEKLNVLDPVSREYIYYCYLLSGQRKEAIAYYLKNKSLIGENVKDHLHPVKELSIDLSYFSNTEEYINTLIKPENISDINGYPVPGYQITTRRFFYSGLFFQHELGGAVDLIHGASILRKYDYYYTQTTINSFETDEHRTNQLQYYARLKINPGYGIRINPSFHYMNYSTPSISYRERRMGTLFYIPAERSNYFSARLSVSKSIWITKIKTGMNISNLNNTRQLQNDIHFSLFPIGNLNLYSITSGFLVRENQNNKTLKRKAFKELIGFRINDNFWMEASGIIGEIKNMSINEGAIVYNGNETITQNFAVSLIFPTETMKFSLTGSFQEFYNTFSNPDGYDLGINKLTFNAYSITGGLSWYF